MAYGLPIRIRCTDCQSICLIGIPNPPTVNVQKNDKEKQGHLRRRWTTARRLWWWSLVARRQHERWRQRHDEERTQTEGEEEYCSGKKRKRKILLKNRWRAFLPLYLICWVYQQLGWCPKQNPTTICITYCNRLGLIFL